MTEILCSYIGDLKCDSIHINLGKRITTDAPLDHYGKGENFSPTDLLAASLGSCLITIMAIKARNKGWEIENIKLKIKKTMTDNSNRQIKELFIEIFLPIEYNKSQYRFLKEAAEECPVTKSLSKSLSMRIKWHCQSNVNDY